MYVFHAVVSVISFLILTSRKYRSLAYLSVRTTKWHNYKKHFRLLQTADRI